jgi:type VI secretion system protein ImpF
VEQAVTLSVLDRLIDRDPGNRAERALTWAQSVQVLKAAVRRDLEWLLNTRRVIEPAPEGATELAASLFYFGLPDISSMSADSPDVTAQLRRHLEEVIAAFEPRLTDVRVTLAEEDESGARELRFVIDGLLRMDPSPEHVQFDTVLQSASGKFDVAGDGGA